MLTAAAIILVAASALAGTVWPKRRTLTIGLAAIAVVVAVAAVIEAIA
jgi:preprotein translocase subunit SecE